jgi:O-antigen/teichoic acid export membrane protein
LVGIASSVNRYVAHYRATGDTEGLNRTVSSVTCVLAVMAALIVALGVGATFVVSAFLGDLSAEAVTDAQWLVVLIAAGGAVEVALSGYAGVLTGCYRHGVANAIGAGGVAVATAAMVLSLAWGGGLVSLGVINLCGEVLRTVAICAAAYWVCPGLRVHFSLARWSAVRQLVAFGGKTLMFSAAALIQNQGASIIIVAFLGPMVLALWSRSMALIRNTMAIVQRFSVVITPTASSLQAMGKMEEMRDVLVTAGRYGAYITVPIIVVLMTLGDPILNVWMGANYEQGLVLAILAAGHIGILTQRSAFNVLVGLNAHGRVGLVNMAAAISSVGLMAVALGLLRSGLPGVAAAMTAPLTLAGFYMPMHTCRLLGIPFGQYLIRVLKGPVLCALPLAACCGISRIVFSDQHLWALLCGLLTGGVALAPFYWRFALPATLKATLRRVSGRVIGVRVAQ